VYQLAAARNREEATYADGDGYVLSIKDTRNACHYGIFSDEQGPLYEMSPQVP
jgi:hypothetical protein